MEEKHQYPLRSFCIDFNWDFFGRPASPGLYAHADPETHLRYYADLGVNTIQTFCVSYNGFAWYRNSKTAPITPGLKTDFLPELTRLGHKEGMKVMGYFCAGANSFWENKNKTMTHMETPENTWRIPMTEQYLDYFCAQIQEALKSTEIDGFMIDWFKPPTRSIWLECEKDAYEKFFSEKFPVSGEPEKEQQIAFDRWLIENAWKRIRQSVYDVRPAVIWTNHPFRQAEDPIWNNSIVMKEADWILNEGPDVTLLDWIRRERGPETWVIQNLCGWAGHDAKHINVVNAPRTGLYGFAQADPDSTLPSNLYGNDVNIRNIEVIKKMFHS